MSKRYKSTRTFYESEGGKYMGLHTASAENPCLFERPDDWKPASYMELVSQDAPLTPAAAPPPAGTEAMSEAARKKPRLASD